MCDVLCLVTQLCLTLSNLQGTLACQAPLSILQARILEWVAMPSSRGSSQPRDQTQVSCIAGRLFTIWATRKKCIHANFYSKLRMQGGPGLIPGQGTRSCVLQLKTWHSKTENKKIASHIPPLFFQAICAAITCLPVGHPHQSRSLNADMFYSSVQPLYLRNVPTSSINIYWIIIYRGTFCNQGNLRVQRWIRNHLLSRNLKLSCYLVAKLCLILFQPHRL